MIQFDSNLNIFYSSLIADKTFSCGFTTKICGDMRRTENIDAFFSSANLFPKTIVLPEQIHSVNIAVFNPPKEQAHPIEILEDTDAVLTDLPHVALIVRTADCVPVIFIDKKKSILGISHQGWRGTLKKMVCLVIKKMKDLGSKPEDIRVSIGPSINDCCYSIDEDRRYEFLSEFNGYSNRVLFARRGQTYLNLPLLNYLLLVEEGVRKEAIDYFPFCTSCDEERFFSYRRDHKKNYGNMLHFIVRN